METDEDAPLVADILLTRAREIAEDAHEGQEREGDGFHIDHVLRVVDRCRTPELRLVAMLHDVVEDSDWTLEDLREGFPPHIVEAVDAITRRDCLACLGRGGYIPVTLLKDAVVRVREGLRVSVEMARQAATCALNDKRVRKTCKMCSGSGVEGRESYITRVKENELAREVKKADATDNMGSDPRPGMRERYQWWLEQLEEG